MSQISFKIPSSEKEFLKWWSDLQAEPMSSVYRNATLEAFRQWKKEILLNEYKKGTISFKKFCNIGNYSFEEATLLFQNEIIEPPISKIIDEYTGNIRKSIKLNNYRKK